MSCTSDSFDTHRIAKQAEKNTLILIKNDDVNDQNDIVECICRNKSRQSLVDLLHSGRLLKWRDVVGRRRLGTLLLNHLGLLLIDAEAHLDHAEDALTMRLRVLQ